MDLTRIDIYQQKKITFFNTTASVCDALSVAFAGLAEISVLNKSVNDLPPYDCLVTAGNSYGIMNGGIDLAVRDMLGITFQDALQWAIVAHYGGRLPVGCSICVDVENDKFRKVIYAPTMEKPKRIVPNDISVVFYNILSTFYATDCLTLACCGLGTGTGGISPEAHAKILKETYTLYKEATQ